MKKQLDIVVGTRPNVIKAAPLCRALLEETMCTPRLVIVHQHTDERMLMDFIREFSVFEDVAQMHIRLDPNDSETRKQRLAHITDRVQAHWRPDPPDAVVVIGDVDTTVAAAQAAKSVAVPLIHLEAGLRSHNLEMPEEHNRIETDRFSDLLLLTRSYAADQLKVEGFEPSKMVLTGNVALDAMRELDRDTPEEAGHLLVTLHRPANVDDRISLEKAVTMLQKLGKQSWVRKIRWPLHPRTEQRLEQTGLRSELEQIAKLECTDPLSYAAFASELHRAEIILTDSGGVQEEAVHLGKPCVVLRTETEHQHALQSDRFELLPLGEATDRAIAVCERLRALEGEKPIQADSEVRASQRAAAAIQQFVMERAVPLKEP
jgi:UDP-N-acetylglucosamine 2-epimerase